MLKKPLLLFILVLALLAAAFFAFPKPTPVQTPTPIATKPSSTVSVSASSSITIPSFSPLANLPPKPDFIPALVTSTDIRVDSHYQTDPSIESPDYHAGGYVDSTTDENYFLIPKSSNFQKRPYGGTNFPIFKSVESHAYQGTPIYIANESSNYSLSYIGFKMSDHTLLSQLSVELGIDFMGGFEQSLNSPKPLANIFGMKTACACGPGLYLRRVGNSNLEFIKESDDVSWYTLKTPISLYNLPNAYCDDPNDEYCGVGTGAGLSGGNLRMHIYYVPNDKEGALQIQLADIILKDKDGNFVEPSTWDNYDHYYRAYLQ